MPFEEAVRTGAGTLSWPQAGLTKIRKTVYAHKAWGNRMP